MVVGVVGEAMDDEEYVVVVVYNVDVEKVKAPVSVELRLLVVEVSVG
jgi:hypothetical protein